MRRERPELIGDVRPVRTAVLWALAFSAGAAVAGLALPLIVMHAIDTALRASTLSAFTTVAGAALIALLARELLLAARNRMLLRASLWLSHSLGASTLSAGLDAVRTPNALSHDNTSLDHVSRCLRQVSEVLDAVVVVVPLLLLVALVPVAGMVTLLACSGAVGLILVVGMSLRTSLPLADKKRAEADHAWRTAAASSVVIAARGMTAGVVHDWQGLSNRAIAAQYALGQRAERAAAGMRVLHLLSTLAMVVVCVVLSRIDMITPGVVAAVILLHEGCMVALARALRLLPDISLAQQYLTALALAPSLPAAPSQPATVAASEAEATPSHAPPQRRAEAS